ncbi:oligosaccharide flippase family protein [Phaeobacter marinintestinus]|uniref:oligosaccharide flippase family protein n=1 Tax=Falsiphaeobacter marinintestinus TaxID=1492905 RepID=UPI0011B79948|nr:oligosaccharide flippase family protein [Phaeobacter marinintestinus]
MKSATIKGRAAAWSVPLANELAALARSVILARLLGPEELGKVMLLALALRLVEMASDVSIERLLAQSHDGDDPGLQHNLQGITALRGLALAIILLALAVPLAMAFSDGPAVASYALLALVPLIRGFVHLDYRRRERHFDYRGLAIVDGGAAIVMICVTPVFAALIGDHRALLGIIVVQVAAQFLLSHLVAERRYRLLLERDCAVRVWTFGAPLILNAGLLFLTFQADRLIVAGYYGWAELGLYGVALQLALLPAQIAGRAAGSLLAPKFRRAIAAGNLAQAARPALQSYLALSAVFLLGFGILAAPVIRLVYGQAFVIDQTLIWALGLAAAIRIARTPVSQLALALGKTSIPLRGNILRALAIIPALMAAMAGAPLYALALAAVVGEAMAGLRAWFLLKNCLSAQCGTSTKSEVFA